MLINILFLILGFLLLIKGADIFIESSSKIAKKIGVSEFIIGLTLTSVGTSIPELASGISASLGKHSGLIFGISAYLRSMKTRRKIYERDGYILITSIILFLAFSLDNVLSQLESFFLLALYFFYIMFLLKSKNTKTKKYKFHDFIQYVVDFKYITSVKSHMFRKAVNKVPSQRTESEKKIIQLFKEGIFKDIMILVISLVAIIFGSKFMIEQAVFFANLLSINESVIGLSLVAIGTSMPELMVSISAIRKKHHNLILGNVIGSNIANVCLIGGVSGIIHPITISELSVTYNIPVMLFFSLALTYFVKSKWKISRKQGIIVLVAYFIFIVLAFISGWR